VVHCPAAIVTMPPKLDKLPGEVVADDWRNIEAARAHTTDDKLRALKQYRCARVLCDKCAKKWVPGHRCAPSVQLQAIQEMWDLFSDDDCQFDDLSCPDCSDTPTQLNMMVSEAAVQVVESPKSMRMWGEIQGVAIMILIDSSSSHTFVAEKLLPQLSIVCVMPKSLCVQVANRTKVCCEVFLPQASWEIQGVKFCSDLKVLPKL
jgi:hypothetical protein